MREHRLSRHVAHGPDAVRRAHLVIDLDEAGVGVEAGALQAETARGDRPPRGDEQAVRDDVRAVVQADHRRIAARRHRGRRDPGAHGDAVREERILEDGGGLGLATRKEPWAGFDDRHPCPEPRHQLTELAPDRAPTQDGDRLGQHVCGDEVVGGPERDLVEPGYRRDGRLGARRDHDPASGGEDGAIDGHGTGPDEPAAPPDQRSAPVPEALDAHRVVAIAGHLGADLLSEDPPIRSGLDRTRHAACAGDLGDEVGRPDHPLRREAGPVRALPAHEGRLDAHHLQPGVQELERQILATRPDAHHDDIGFSRHGHPPPPTRSPGAARRDHRCRLTTPRLMGSCHGPHRAQADPSDRGQIVRLR